MPQLIPIITAITGVLGVGTALKARKDALKAQRKQEADAKLAIENDAALARNAGEKKGAQINFGTGASDELLKRGVRKKVGGSGAADVGGTTASSVGGL